MKMPPALFVSGSTRRIRTRSCNGRSFIDGLLGPGFRRVWHSRNGSAIRYSAMWDRIRRNTTKNSTRWINVQTRQNMNRNCIQFDDLNFTYSDCLDMPGRSSCRKAWPTRHGPAVYRPCQDGIRSGYYKNLDCRYGVGFRMPAGRDLSTGAAAGVL